jgi:hypothetical protein
MNAQELSCADFKEGAFSIEGYVNGTTIKYDIIRYPDFQEEHFENMDPIKVNIKWIDDCSYILTADPARAQYDDIAREINDSGGIRVSLLEIKDNCFLFKSIANFDGEDVRLDGKICKDRI